MISLHLSLFNRLPIRMVTPVVVVITLVGLGLYMFILRSVSEFADLQIREAVENVAIEIYDICDENFTELMQSGKMNDHRAVRIKKAFTLGAIEDFTDRNVDAYGPLVTRVKIFYVITAALLLFSIIVILHLQQRALQRPLNRIIKAIQAGRSPTYKGIQEFEFLSDSITAMMHSLEERNKDRLLLENKLQKARKMEAIGTLAGGVAHDLNNILSEIVSYPDFMLMDLPQESPLRKPLLTIKRSGERAAMIVDDMLTLARRGVATAEVVNLNTIISDQLKSPEFLQLQTLFPETKVETRFETDLLNIKGSTIHLAKSIMNILTNAAEAMPDGGKILVTTNNRYVDFTIKGYDNVEEGDYVTVTISDKGIGISKEDLERIFEPFYTKKVMGKSGTGLGMAVVWGAVKDHNGYIDLVSTRNEGTTFTLYFPVCREANSVEENSLVRPDYMGEGESILVVDDASMQRILATAMLKKLGYRVKSVDGGEAAVAYLKDHSVDLVVLDMIMVPGIDGLETYKRIVERQPRQKAIIASGYSETYRVKEAQRLGAGQYINKPYTLEKIGLAVKAELEKDDREKRKP